MAGFFTYYQKRKMEWFLAIYTAVYGLALFAPHESMKHPGYTSVIDMMSELHWACLFTVTGVLHMAALHVNGRAAWTPFARLIVLFVNAQVLTAFAVAFIPLGVFSTAVVNYSLLALLGCYPAMWFAAKDCGAELAIMQACSRHGKH